MKMKRLIAVAGLTLLSACGTKTVYVTETKDPEPKVTTTVKKTTTTTEALPMLTTEDQFLMAIYSVYDGDIYASDDLLIDIGNAMCGLFRGGGNSWTASQAIVQALPNDPDAQILATAVTAAAVLYFCPDQGYKLED